jgi:hypothetical protein
VERPSLVEVLLSVIFRRWGEPVGFSSSGFGLGRDPLGGAFANAPMIPPDIDRLAVVVDFAGSGALRSIYRKERVNGCGADLASVGGAGSSLTCFCWATGFGFDAAVAAGTLGATFFINFRFNH